MNNKLGTLIGLLVLLAGGVGIYVIFGHESSVEEEFEQATETVVPVEVGQIRRMTMHYYVRAYGSIIPNPGIGDSTPASIRINSPVDGLVSEVHCIAGQQVRKGQVLFTLYDRPAELLVEQAEKTVSFAQENFERQEKLKEVQGTSTKLYLEAQQQLDNARNQLRQAQAELDILKVTAPFDGTIMEVITRSGQAVMQTDILGQLTDLKRLVAGVYVSVPEATRLKPGYPVEFETIERKISGDQQTPVLIGQIVYIDHHANPNNGTVTVLVTIPSNVIVLPGQFVQTRIIAAEYNDLLAVPEDSVVITPQGQTIVAIVADGEAILTPVKRGLSENGWVGIEGKGLVPEMTVVTTGAYGLPGNTRIRVMGQ